MTRRKHYSVREVAEVVEDLLRWCEEARQAKWLTTREVLATINALVVLEDTVDRILNPETKDGSP